MAFNVLKNKLLLIFILYAFWDATSLSQDQELIKYVGLISSDQEAVKKTLFQKIGDLLFGREETDIRNPVDVYADNPDKVWIVCQGNGNLIKKSKNDLSVLPAFRNHNRRMPSLVGICRAGNKILFTDSSDENIYVLSDDGRSYNLLNADLELERPTGIAYSKINEEIWVCETSAHRISILDPEGKYLRSIGHRGTGRCEFNYPTHIWIDEEGMVYIVDSMNFRVQVFDKNGEFITSFGKTGNASGDIARPKGIATDTHGNIYLVDALFHTVQIFDRDGNYLYSFGGQGRDPGLFWMPGGIYIDTNNYIYVADNFNNRVQVFRLLK